MKENLNRLSLFLCSMGRHNQKMEEQITQQNERIVELLAKVLSSAPPPPLSLVLSSLHKPKNDMMCIELGGGWGGGRGGSDDFTIYEMGCQPL